MFTFEDEQNVWLWKKKVKKSAVSDAAEIFKFFHERENEILYSANKIFVERYNTEYEIAHHLFYLSKYYLSPDYMGYALGFFEGMAQGKGYADDELKGDLLVNIINIYGKTIVNYREAIGFSENEGEWDEKFYEFFLNREFESDEEAANELVKGLAEGKALNDALISIQNDYSRIKDESMNETFLLPGMTHQIKMWFAATYLDKEKLQFIVDTYGLEEWKK